MARLIVPMQVRRLPDSDRSKFLSWLEKVTGISPNLIANVRFIDGEPIRVKVYKLKDGKKYAVGNEAAHYFREFDISGNPCPVEFQDG